MYAVNQMIKQKMPAGRVLGLFLLFLLGGIQIAVAAEDSSFRAAEGGVMIRDLEAGSGNGARLGQVATIHFKGWVDNGGDQGKAFIDSRQEGRPVSFVIGTEKVMPAWNVGVLGMKPGGKRKVMIPPAMGYASRSVDDVVPANADLVFIIELIDLRD